MADLGDVATVWRVTPPSLLLSPRVPFINTCGAAVCRVSPHALLTFPNFACAQGRPTPAGVGEPERCGALAAAARGDDMSADAPPPEGMVDEETVSGNVTAL